MNEIRSYGKIKTGRETILSCLYGPEQRDPEGGHMPNSSLPQRNYKPPIGTTFNRLTVLSVVPQPGRKYVRCRCSCGVILERVRLASVKSGNTTSCGCVALENIRAARQAVMPYPTKQEQQDICDLYRSGRKLDQVSHESGFCITTVTAVLDQHGIARRKRGTPIGEGPVRAVDDSEILDAKRRWDVLDTGIKGTIAESHVTTRLSELGFDVWVPYRHNHTTDLLVIQGKSILRIQVKSGTYDARTKSFRANITRRRRGGKAGNYSLDDVDFFIIYCGGLAGLTFYVAPAALVIGRSDMRVYPHREKGNDADSRNYERFLNAFDLLRAAAC